MEWKLTVGMQVIQPGTIPKRADPGTMASNIPVPFVLLLAETSPAQTGATGVSGVSIFF